MTDWIIFASTVKFHKKGSRGKKYRLRISGKSFLSVSNISDSNGKYKSFTLNPFRLDLGQLHLEDRFEFDIVSCRKVWERTDPIGLPYKSPVRDALIEAVL